MRAVISTSMMMRRIITMTDQALLRLLAWLSPAFPVGAFAYSHGLEWAVEAGDITDQNSLLAWVRDVLRHGAGRSDLILLRQAHRASGDAEELKKIAELASATSASRERQIESLGQGTAFVMAAAPWRVDLLVGVEHVPYAVAVGAFAGASEVAEDDAALGFLHAFAANLISAAVRLVPLGQSAGLIVLAALERDLLDVTADTRDAGLNDLGGCCFRSDLAAIAHETQYTRLFRS